jgi:sulfur transfer protein SufE
MSKLELFLDSLDSFGSQPERVEFLIDYAERFKPVPSSVAQKPYPPHNRVEYCESGAYVWTQKGNDGRYKFYFDVENPHGISAKVLCAILDENLSGATADEILSIKPDIIYRIFGQSLSMGKNLGLSGIILMIQNQVRRLE